MLEIIFLKYSLWYFPNGFSNLIILSVFISCHSTKEMLSLLSIYFKIYFCVCQCGLRLPIVLDGFYAITVIYFGAWLLRSPSRSPLRLVSRFF